MTAAASSAMGTGPATPPRAMTTIPTSGLMRRESATVVTRVPMSTAASISTHANRPNAEVTPTKRPQAYATPMPPTSFAARYESTVDTTMRATGATTRYVGENDAWLCRSATSAMRSTRQQENDMHTSGDTTRPAEIGYRKLMTFCRHARKRPNPTATNMSSFDASFPVIQTPLYQTSAELVRATNYE